MFVLRSCVFTTVSACILSAIAKLLVYLLGTESGWEGVE